MPSRSLRSTAVLVLVLAGTALPAAAGAQRVGASLYTFRSDVPHASGARADVYARPGQVELRVRGADAGQPVSYVVAAPAARRWADSAARLLPGWRAGCPDSTAVATAPTRERGVTLSAGCYHDVSDGRVIYDVTADYAGEGGTVSWATYDPAVLSRFIAAIRAASAASRATTPGRGAGARGS